ncbi:MAG TPA: hypothetical protein VF695_15975, partial [Sphingomonas sp.]
QRRERSLRSLYCCSDGVRGRGAPVTNLSHTASFHPNERIAPSNRGIKQASGYAEMEGVDADLPRLTKPFRNADLIAKLTEMETAGSSGGCLNKRPRSPP